MTSRPLTAAERNLAASIFGRAIDYDQVLVHNRKWFWFQSRRITMAPDGHIWFHPEGGLFCEEFCATPLHRQSLFMHEMTHVWQHQRGIRLVFRRHPFCRYNYSLKPGWTLERYGLEQQAEIVRHVFLLRRGVPVPGAPPLSHYEGILPFEGIKNDV